MASLTSLSVDEGALPVASCASCGQRALTWLDVGDDGHDVTRCLSCNAAILGAAVERVGVRGAERMGYVFLQRRQASTKRSGCGAKGVRGCGSGGCSTGSCGSGSGGGCGSGGCGSGG